MKKVISVALAMLMAFVFVGNASAVKPDPNLAGAGEVPWNLSADVMPVPPWGLKDIPGSDSASKLIVNQPNGNTEVAMTGAMNGLNPDTEYTVYLSDGWTTVEKWNITGEWDLRFVLGGNYDHRMTVTFQNMHNGNFTGTGYYLANPGYTWDIEGTSQVIGDSITLDLSYTGIGAGYTVHATGEIDASGYIVNGNWSSSASQSGDWSSLSGTAIQEVVGAGWPGLFHTQQTFTFMTDEFGAGSWHINLRDADFPGPGTYTLSVWINESGSSILISDNFDIVVD